jgi:hypothetical protein
MVLEMRAQLLILIPWSGNLIVFSCGNRTEMAGHFNRARAYAHTLLSVHYPPFGRNLVPRCGGIPSGVIEIVSLTSGEPQFFRQ